MTNFGQKQSVRQRLLGTLCDHHRRERSGHGRHPRPPPLVLPPEHIKERLAPEMPPSRAEVIAKKLCQPTEELEWFPAARRWENRAQNQLTHYNFNVADALTSKRTLQHLVSII